MQDLHVKLNQLLPWHKRIQQQEDPYDSKLDENLRKKVVKCSIRCTAVYGDDSWTLRKIDRKYL